MSLAIRRRSRVAWAVLIGNAMAWFGSAAFVLGLAGEQLDALASSSWPRVVGFALVAAVGVTLAIGGVLDNRRIRTCHTKIG